MLQSTVNIPVTRVHADKVNLHVWLQLRAADYPDHKGTFVVAHSPCLIVCT